MLRQQHVPFSKSWQTGAESVQVCNRHSLADNSLRLCMGCCLQVPRHGAALHGD